MPSPHGAWQPARCVQHSSQRKRVISQDRRYALRIINGRLATHIALGGCTKMAMHSQEIILQNSAQPGEKFLIGATVKTMEVAMSG